MNEITYDKIMTLQGTKSLSEVVPKGAMTLERIVLEKLAELEKKKAESTTQLELPL